MPRVLTKYVSKCQILGIFNALFPITQGNDCYFDEDNDKDLNNININDNDRVDRDVEEDDGDGCDEWSE